MGDEDEVQSFEHHMRTYQQADDSSRHKEHANAANANKEKPYCNWCFKQKGVKWAHSEDNCNNKKRAESARGDADNRIKRRLCCLPVDGALRQGLSPCRPGSCTQGRSNGCN